MIDNREKKVLWFIDCFIIRLCSTRTNRSRSTPVSASVKSAGHILFNDNTLIPFNSIIGVSKWPSTAKVGARDLKALRFAGFTSEQDGFGNISVSPLLSVAPGTIS